MIGGGIIFIDDKARGLHEGYLVTPISKLDLILGFNLAGAIKAILAGFVLITVGSLIAGIPDPLNVLRMARMMVLVRAHFAGADQHDVPAHGACERSAACRARFSAC